MDSRIKRKIAIFICLVSFTQVHGTPYDKESVYLLKNTKSDFQDSAKSTVKRSADWSKRISLSDALEIPEHVAEESENIEVTPKAPRIIRRMRVHHRGKQGVEVFKEIPPESRVADGVNKIVRVKKFKRKLPRMSPTVIPETLTSGIPESISTMQATDSPKLTSTSPYSHITVINKEIKNPKIKKNKKKKRKQQFIPTPSYDTESKDNGVGYATDKPDFSYFKESQPNENAFNKPDYFPEFQGFYNKRHSTPISRQKEVETDQIIKPFAKLGEDKEIIMMRMPQHYVRNINEMERSSYLPTLMIEHQHMSPVNIFAHYPDEDIPGSTMNSSFKDNLKGSSTQLKEVRKNLENATTESPLQKDNKTDVTIDRAGTLVKAPPEKSKVEVFSLKKEAGNKTAGQHPNPESEAILRSLPIAAVPNSEVIIPLQNSRFTSRFPSMLYGEQGAFSDPFFDTPAIPSPVHRLSSWNHPLSPFYPSDGPQRGQSVSVFNDGLQPYQADDLMLPGFHHNPQLATLRRSILDTYEDETTPPEPVTPFSLPKFEMPSIDFNDKGCQTVYKEVKTVPGEGPQSRNSNAKSFVVARECYFPNGVPTTEQTKMEIVTEAPVVLRTPKSEVPRLNAKKFGEKLKPKSTV